MKFLYFLPIALFLSCGDENPEATNSSDSEITEEVVETENELELSTQIVEDLDNETFKEKLNTSMDFYSDDFSAQLDSLNKDAVVYVYCQAGGRSGKARDMLSDKGFSQIYNLENGFSQWDK